MSLVSIIMPYYKKELFVEDSIKSILNQSYKDFEIILINDDIEKKDFIETISNIDLILMYLHKLPGPIFNFIFH